MRWFPNHKGFPFDFLHRPFSHTKVHFQMGEEGQPVVGGGGSLMTHSAGSVTTQSIELKYMMASEPYRYT
jgi:hypothetical protein